MVRNIILTGLLFITITKCHSQVRELELTRPTRTLSGLYVGIDGIKIDSIIMNGDTLLTYVNSSATPFKSLYNTNNPQGSSGDIQYNNSGSFEGAPLTTNGTDISVENNLTVGDTVKASNYYYFGDVLMYQGSTGHEFQRYSGGAWESQLVLSSGLADFNNTIIKVNNQASAPTFPPIIPANGMMYYNTTSNAFEFRQNDTWVNYGTGIVDSLFHDDTQTWIKNLGTIPKGDSTREVITATDTMKSKLIYNADSVIITSGVSEYKFIDDTAQLGTNNIKLKNLYATDNVQADTHKFGTNNYMIDAPQNNILEWNIANSYYRPFTSETDGVIYSGAVDPDFDNSSRANFAGGWGVSKLYTSFINITEAGEDGDGLYYKAETDPRLEFTASGTEVYTYLELPGISSPFYLYYNSSSNDSEINFELNTAGDNKISLQTNNLKTQNYNNEFQIIKTSAPSDTIVRVTLDSIILNKPVSIETTLSIGDSLQYPDGSWTTGTTDAQTAIETMDFDSLHVDNITGATESDSINIQGNLFINGRVLRETYEAFAYEDPDSTITTSISTSWIFLGSGGNYKLKSLNFNGFSYDGDTLVFNQASNDYRDSVEFRINYGGQNATSNVNKSIYNGIFVKSVGESTYTEYRPCTKVSRTITADIYYTGPSCPISPIWLKNGDKIQVQSRCGASTTTLSTKNFSAYIHEE